MPFPNSARTLHDVQGTLMAASAKVVVVSQHYPPDPSTTAAIMAEISEHLAAAHPVLVLSGWPGSATGDAVPDRPHVVEIRNRIPEKGALMRRAVAELGFTARAFVMVLWQAQRGDVVLTVTAPFMLPYAITFAAWLKRAKSALIMHDLYPDVLVMSGLVGQQWPVAWAISGANALMFRMLDAVITIGRDTARLLLRYRGVTPAKIRFIPNWATLAPAVRPVATDNPYRNDAARFVVGLSGNLGFTHDPLVVFEAARLLAGEPDIHFLLSGWGVGYERLKQLQSDARLANVTLVDRVADGDLEKFLTAADAWIIPYRKNVAGVSVPSRFYNLLAVGRPVILVSERNAEAAMTVSENNLGWVVRPGMPDELAGAIRRASVSADASMGERAVVAARAFTRDRAMTGYGALVDELLRAGPSS
jgi:glycosyltransferase involved in cell wall biosynthesis